MSASPRLTKDDFRAWRDHPVTVIVRRYLTDSAAKMRDDWAQGENWSDQARMEVLNFEQLADIDLESIETFYEARDTDEQSTSEADQPEDQRHGY